MSDDARPQLAVLPGLNVWQLLRTDRDAVTAGEVVETAGPAVFRFLRELEPSGEPWEIVQTGPGEYRMGGARPVLISVARQPFARPQGRLLGDRVSSLPGAGTVEAASPWYVLVRFWWRGASGSIDYPAVKVGMLGFRSWQWAGADWLLDWAVKPTSEGVDPGDATWGEEQWKRVEAGTEEIVSRATSVGKGLVWVGLAAAVVYLAASFRQSPRVYVSTGGRRPKSW